MGFGGSFSGQNQSLIASMLGQQQQLSGQQTAFNAQAAQSDTDIQQQARQTLNMIEGNTPNQQKKSVNMGIMDFIKTSPTGLSNTPNTGLNMLG